ncbi:RtcB family protein [Sulfobacillus acidophilus]|uniref:tRNA-splicing ligase RtcB n=1 Tax=Sulfobacillus acidophilus TaxID=53633 RepID=A0ABS3AVM0_9FIRM|nr:RtcB family protein [Sulfobacillus acidophilus]
MNRSISRNAIKKISDYLYEIPASFREDMKVPARIFVSEKMLEKALSDNSLWQLVNVATLPGIQKYALAMADIHQGYGFPIGGIAAVDIANEGAISPGGIGYDINCGIRLLASNNFFEEVKPKIKDVAFSIFNAVPSGTGKGGAISLKTKELEKVLQKGARYLLEKGYGIKSDIEFCEEKGAFENVDFTQVSSKAKKRGQEQIGTLGSGNHFLEIQIVDEIFDEKAAAILGLEKNQVTIMIHCGSRGLGHQVCTDYVHEILSKQDEWGYNLVDRQLACAPFNSIEGQNYLQAMKAAANFAWANRHMITHRVREVWQSVFGPDCKISTVYDVSHNIGKCEFYEIDGKRKELFVHRKGATRAFGPNHKDIPLEYRPIGQPVLIPGDMGTASYVLLGTQKSIDESFGSICHGAGRAMSRTKAKKQTKGFLLRQELEEKGITVCCNSDRGLAEEAPIAYKNIDEVINVVTGAKLAKKVARLKPIAVIKGD